MRPIALGRKNICSPARTRAENWAIHASLIETCKMNDVDPYTYLADTLTRIVGGHLASAIDKLLPWAYARAQPLKDAA